jgi:uncharacterized protein
MDRVNKILNHELFLQHLQKNMEAEKTRIFCHHDMTHFLDVARIGMLINLEEDIRIDKEWIYAAALLHDIGKHIQYENGTPHEKSSAQIAPLILRDCGFDEKETDVIVSAIATHRDKNVQISRDLNGILYRADKLSRSCFACDAKDKCNWDDSKKNLEIFL